MRTVVYELLSALNEKMIGPMMRQSGKQLYELGKKVEGGTEINEDRITPSLRNLNYENKQPFLEHSHFVAPNAVIIGDVDTGVKSSIWYGATLLGTSSIKIGNNSVIQDRVHISRKVEIGDNVFVGPNSIIQGSTLKNWAFVSMGATVRHATIESGGLVAAGAVIFDDVVVKEGQIWAGNPGRFLRNITPLERQVLKEHLEEMQDLAAIHSQQTERSTRDVINGTSYRQDMNNDWSQYMKNLQKFPFEHDSLDTQFVELRLVLKDEMNYVQFGKDYEPYRFEHKGMPQKFRIGIHDEEIQNIALKLKEKEEFKNSRDPWTKPF